MARDADERRVSKRCKRHAQSIQKKENGEIKGHRLGTGKTIIVGEKILGQAQELKERKWKQWVGEEGKELTISTHELIHPTWK